MTANMVYRRRLLERVGGFDERFHAAFLEDSDLAFRVQEAGYEIPFASDVVVRHPVVKLTPRQVLRSTRNVRWLALFASKHPQSYWTQLRPVVRPFSRVDVHVTLGVAAALAVPRTRGISRLVMLAAALNGARVAVASSRALDGPREERPWRLFLGFAVPLVRMFWWIESMVAFRKVYW